MCYISPETRPRHGLLLISLEYSAGTATHSAGTATHSAGIATHSAGTATHSDQDIKHVFDPYCVVPRKSSWFEIL